MPSQSRALEASFEPSDKSAVPLGSEPIPALEDFDSFFEKLNNLEQVDWRSAHPANPEIRPRPQAKPDKDFKATASKADPLAGLKAAVAQAKQSQRSSLGPSTSDLPPLKSKKPRALSGAFRFAATAFVLFIVGMGIGWAALSLPSKLNSTGGNSTATTAPTPNGLVIEPKVSLPDKAGIGTSGDRMDTIVPLTEVTPPNSSADAATIKPLSDDGSSKVADSKSIADLPADLAASKVAVTEKADTAKEDTDIASGEAADNQDSQDTVAAAPSIPAPHKTALRAKSTKRVAAKTKDAPVAVPVAATATDPGAPHFAVQVGACRSARCVDTYRKLITTHLPANADNIHVVPVSADSSGVQRIRVAPLDKAEAQQLRTTLVQADPRLSTAYVVEVRP